MTGLDKDIFRATRTLTTLLNEACNHWNYLCPYLEKLGVAADRALEGYQKDYPNDVDTIIAEDRKTKANDIAVMRKALEEMAADLEDLASRDAIRAPAYSSIFSIYAEKCRKALAAPPRNCDVGTAEEQAERLHRFCISQDCVTCPCDLGKADGRCEFAWMQMPYKEGCEK